MRHSWQLSVEQAREVQRDLARRIMINPLPSPIKRIAGFDVSYLKEHNTLIAGMVILEYPSLELLDQHIIREKITFPYIPGYLSFREAPALIQLIDSFADNIDVLIFDGHGLAHPRGLGIASHIGVLIDHPSIGCAKKKLVGIYEEPAHAKGSVSDLTYKDMVVGKVVRTRDRVKPVFISPGHRSDVDSSVNLIINCCTRFRIPEPTRLAHQIVTREKNNLN